VIDSPLERRVLRLTRKYGVAQRDVLGAYTVRPLRQVEFLLHEVSHWLTLGHNIKKVPRRLSSRIGEQFQSIGDPSANALEIDASLVTYLAGWLLGLWTDPMPIVKSCRRNLKGIISLESNRDNDVLKEFVKRWREHSNDYETKAKTLARWLQPSAKIPVLSGYAFPESLWLRQTSL